MGQTERYSDLLSQSLHADPGHSSEVTATSKQSQLNAVDEDGEGWLLFFCCDHNIVFVLKPDKLLSFVGLLVCFTFTIYATWLGNFSNADIIGYSNTV